MNPETQTSSIPPEQIKSMNAFEQQLRRGKVLKPEDDRVLLALLDKFSGRLNQLQKEREGH